MMTVTNSMGIIRKADNESINTTLARRLNKEQLFNLKNYPYYVSLNKVVFGLISPNFIQVMLSLCVISLFVLSHHAPILKLLVVTFINGHTYICILAEIT